MKILIAEDDRVTRRVLERTLRDWDHEVIACCNGREAWEVFQQPEPPRLALLNWMMPEMDGVEICKSLRAAAALEHTYVIMITARTERADLITGLEIGVDEYLTKPFDIRELRARIDSGRRILDLQLRLADRVRALETTLTQVKQLRGLLPICCYCKRIRDDGDYWQQLESYLMEHSEVQFSHGICPQCLHQALTKPEACRECG